MMVMVAVMRMLMLMMVLVVVMMMGLWENMEERDREEKTQPWVVARKRTHEHTGGTSHPTGMSWGNVPEEVTMNRVLQDQGKLAKEHEHK